MRAAPIIAVAIATGLLLTGCTGVAEPEPTVSPVADATIAPAPSPSAPEVPAGTVVATGELVPLVGDIAGSVAVIARGYGLGIEITAFRSDDPVPPQVALWPELPGGEVDCSDNLTGVRSFGRQVVAGDSVSVGWSDGRTAPDTTARDLGDPAHFDALVLEDVHGEAPETGCFSRITAYAALTWTLPAFVDLDPLVDAGIANAAAGTTSSDEQGLTGYTVADGDDALAVAQRFGLTVEEFEYLNPNNNGLDGHPILRPGSTQALRAPARS